MALCHTSAMTPQLLNDEQYKDPTLVCWIARMNQTMKIDNKKNELNDNDESGPYYKETHFQQHESSTNRRSAGTPR